MDELTSKDEAGREKKSGEAKIFPQLSGAIHRATAIAGGVPI